ncbi:hypothetical protein ERX37_05480 [Macrococcus hajekii]|uniref:Phage head-tail adapter protein n=1 Tax=Macrococcus hajekii TaxID=198482 RepID=A0A4R6BPD5_9STAP|nr:hypothetical protein [Macrococcus hajekii]TDM03537.1 hypothetical protein ERX37_05480 [Macrococcus hajekii]GGA99642.1 hypothetical protein GCM10007190_04630 [Macrococcus hajekii]
MTIRQRPQQQFNSGEFRTPIQFFTTSADEGPYPGVKQEKAFFTLSEIYESSTKDLEHVNTTNAKHIVTILFRNPHVDYQIKHSDMFRVLDGMYMDVEFEVQHFAPSKDNKEIIKVVGVAYGS